MKKLIAFLMSMTIIFMMSNCSTTKDDKMTDNPLLIEFNIPFGAPPFDLINAEHFEPAYEVAMQKHLDEIDAIANNKEAPSFENTILAYDNAGRLLRRINPIFSGLRGAETTPELQEAAQKIIPVLTSHYNEIRFNEALFSRIQKVHQNMSLMDYDLEQTRLIEKIYNDFARNGAALPEEQRERLKVLNEKISATALKLTENLLAENNNFILVIDNEKDLAGLPDDVISAAAEEAASRDMNNKWVFTLAKPSWTPFLQYAENRELRKKLLKAYVNRGENDNEYDNKALFVELMVLRQEMSEMLGYNNFGEYFTAIQMAEHPDNVYDFLYSVWEPALNRAKSERDQMQKIMDREEPGQKLKAWDWWYYAELLRKEKYDLNEDQIRPYFSLDNVKMGNFILSNKLFGITYEPRPEVPVYHEEVEVYEVIDYDGSSLGLLYIDAHPRPGKRSGAWCGVYRTAYYDEDGQKVNPIVNIVMNFTRPTGDRPSLLSWDETTTYFHEFGHALHNFFADGRYNRTRRDVPRDFVELPSQILENFAAETELLKKYALHYQTKEPIPNELIERINNAAHFNQGFINTEYLAAAILDMDWHTLEIDPGTCVNEFEAMVFERIGLIDEIYPRYRTTNFAHLFTYDYAAGYYVYRWAGVLDADAFMAFKKSGDLFNRELANKFRKYILAGNARWEGMDAYKNFRGQEPDINYFLERSGLK